MIGAILGSMLGGAAGAAVQFYSAGSDVFSLPERASENIFYTLFSEDYQYRYWEFNMAEDSLIGYRKIKEVPCHGVAPLNQLFYIPFKFVYDDSDLINRTGWLELSLTDDYTFEILRSAISSN